MSIQDRFLAYAAAFEVSIEGEGGAGLEFPRPLH